MVTWESLVCDFSTQLFQKHPGFSLLTCLTQACKSFHYWKGTLLRFGDHQHYGVADITYLKHDQYGPKNNLD